MPKKVAPSRTRAKTVSKVKVVSNRSKGGSSSWLRSKGAALVMALAFMLVGAGTLTWVRAATTTSTLWSTATIPKIISDSDTQAVELGTKFRAQYSGQVLGLRFYKGPQNTGTHTGNLWSSDGRKLASVVFTNETASGWQTANFAVPVDIAANTTYIVSYHAPKGRYSANNNYFTQSYTKGPLTAPRNAGVYLYSAKSGFPNKTYQASNYWVDVVYSTSRFSPTPKPVAPSNLSANVSGTTVTLSWAASTSVGIAKYEILRGGQVVGSVTTGTAYADSGLATNTSYSYQVRAVDAAGVASDLSNKVTATIPPAATPTPEPIPTPTPTPEPTPTPTPTPVGTCTTNTPHVPGGPDGNGGCWPGPGNVGVPAGTTLSNYTGPCTISSGTVVIENKTITCDQFRVKNASTVVVVRKSKFVGSTIWNEQGSGSVPGTLTLEDVTAGGVNDPNYSTLIAINNVTVIRSDISGGQHNIQCVNNCVIRDSYMHGQVVSGTTHNNTFISNGGHDMLLKHNTLKCEVKNVAPDGGCSSDLSLFGDFDTIQRVTADNNLFVANPSGPTYCAYGGSSDKDYPNPNNIVYINNIFQRGSNGKCAAGGPITDFDPSRPGNRWENNRWDDGGTVPSAN